LAFALILYTGLRRSDVVKVGPQHIHDGWLIIEQGKTEGGEEAHLEIPVHPKLREIIDATSTLGLKTFLVTHYGKPYAAGFANCATKRGVSTFRLMADAGRRRVGLRRSGAARTRSPPSPAMRRCRRCSATPRPPTESAWRAKRWLS